MNLKLVEAPCTGKKPTVAIPLGLSFFFLAFGVNTLHPQCSIRKPVRLLRNLEAKITQAMFAMYWYLYATPCSESGPTLNNHITAGT